MFESVRLLNVIGVPGPALLTVCDPVPLKLNVLVPALNWPAADIPPGVKSTLRLP